MTKKRIVITLLIAVGMLHPVDVQMMFPAPQPMFMMPPPPPPPPVAVPVPFPVPVPVLVTRKTTTTATETPEENDGNMILLTAFGNPFAAPVIVMPPSNVRLIRHEDESPSNDYDSEESSPSRERRSVRKIIIDENGKCRRIRVKDSRKRRRFRANHGRVKKRRVRVKSYRKNFRNKRNLEPGDHGFAKPVLTYISKNGNVKFETRISGDDAARLMGEKEMYSESEELSDASQNQPPKEVSLRIRLSKEYRRNATKQATN